MRRRKAFVPLEDGDELARVHVGSYETVILYCRRLRDRRGYRKAAVFFVRVFDRNGDSYRGISGPRGRMLAIKRVLNEALGDD